MVLHFVLCPKDGQERVRPHFLSLSFREEDKCRGVESNSKVRFLERVQMWREDTVSHAEIILSLNPPANLEKNHISSRVLSYSCMLVLWKWAMETPLPEKRNKTPAILLQRIFCFSCYQHASSLKCLAMHCSHHMWRTLTCVLRRGRSRGIQL